jgi:hypothetical protein
LHPRFELAESILQLQYEPLVHGLSLALLSAMRARTQDPLTFRPVDQHDLDLRSHCVPITEFGQVAFKPRSIAAGLPATTRRFERIGLRQLCSHLFLRNLPGSPDRFDR